MAGTTGTSILSMYKAGRREMYGHHFPDGMRPNQKLPQTILTPTSKAFDAGHDEELTRKLDMQHLKGLKVPQVLLGDPLDGDVVDVHLVLLDEVEQQIQRPLKDLQLDFVFRLHWPRPR
jgi:hypothetical protein